MKQIAQDGPGTIFSKGVAPQVSPVSRTRILNGVFHAATAIDNCRTAKTLWTLPSLWTPRTRPQGTWKTAKSAVFHSAHSDHLFGDKEQNEEQRAATMTRLFQGGSQD
jgi:hypothetical protein